MRWDIVYKSIRGLVGAVFLFSGLVKLNDPMGTAIKLEEYFFVFATDGLGFFRWLVPIALLLAVLLVLIEVVLGVALLIGYRQRISMGVSLGLLLFFTMLTFYSAYFDRVTDCGCFGDAIKLTPWQSFGKDVLLLTLVMGLWLAQRLGLYENSVSEATHTSIYGLSQRGEDLMVGASTLVSLALGVYAILFLPFLDFRAYKVGAHIPTLRAPSQPLRYGYEYLKDGNKVILETYIRDTRYQFLSTKILNPEAFPKIKDYSFWNEEEEGTEASLIGKKLLIVVHKAEKISTALAKRIGKQVQALPEGVEVWVISASSKEQYESLRARSPDLAAWPYYYGDATLLKTMVRTNPGLILLQNGTVRGKWSCYALPNAQDIQKALR